MNQGKKLIYAVIISGVITFGSVTVFASDNTNRNNHTYREKMHQNQPGGAREGKEFKSLLTYLKLDEATFKKKIDNKQTLTQIAAEQGIEKEDLVTFLVNDKIKEINKDGNLSQEKVDAIKAKIQEKMEMVVDRVPGKGHRGRGEIQGLVTFLKLTPESFHEKTMKKETLVQIAADQGISKEALVNYLVKEETTKINSLVKDGRITQAQADTMLANLKAKVEEKVTTLPPMKPGHKGMEHDGMMKAE